MSRREVHEFETPQPAGGEPPKNRGCLSIALALLLAGLFFAVLYMLTSGRVLVAALIAGVICGMVAFHYFVWGWWLSGLIRRQVEEEEREE